MGDSLDTTQSIGEILAPVVREPTAQEPELSELVKKVYSSRLAVTWDVLKENWNRLNQKDKFWSWPIFIAITPVTYLTSLIATKYDREVRGYVYK